jgi:hypothetical protein
MQTIDIGKFLKFRGEADFNLNLKGNLNPHRIFREWNFKELALNETNDYTKYVDTSSAVALADGGITLTTAATTSKTCSYAFGGIHVMCAKSPVVEFKFQIDVITNVTINALLSDAVSEASNTLPFAISGTTITATSTNGAGFCFDTDQTTDRFYIVNVKAATQGGTLLSAVQAPFALATNITVRVELDTSGNALYYFNGKKVGYKASATTSTTPLVPYFAIKNLNASAHVATLRYVRLWEDA